MTSHSINDFQAAMGATGNDAVAKLVKVWESKNARRALRGSAMGLMAVSLAACGGSDSNDDGGNGGGGETPVPEPKEFILTTTIDNVVGGEGADTIYGIAGEEEIDEGVDITTWAAGDRIAGGAGYDTLDITLVDDTFDGDGYGTGSTVTGVERLLINDPSYGGSSFDVDGFDAALELVEISTGYDGGSYYIYNLDAVVDLKVVGTGEDTTEQDVYVYFEDAADAMYEGDADTFDVTVVDVGKAEDGSEYLDIYAPTYYDDAEAIENLDITVGGENGSAVEWYADDGLENVTIRNATGSTAALSLYLDYTDALETIDASALAGDFYLNTSVESAEDLTITGAAGDNNFYDSGIYTDAAEQAISVTTFAGADGVYVEIDTGDDDVVVDITTGAGDDYAEIWNDGGADAVVTISVGAGNDEVVVDAYAGMSIDVGTGLDQIDMDDVTNLDLDADGAVEDGSLITISGFGTDDDLDLDGAITMLDSLSVADRTALIDAANADDATMADVLAVADGIADVAGEAVAFEFGGETYLYVNNDGGAYSEGLDGLIHFKDTAVSDLTDGNVF